MRERLKAGPHEAVIRHLLAPQLTADASRYFDSLLRANAVHILLLRDIGVVSDDEARTLTTLFDEMGRSGPSAVTMDPALEDLYFNVEQHVRNVVGPDIAGRMHTGRSRNDLNATTARMRVRTDALTIFDKVIALREVLLRRAWEFSTTLMTGYTHLQPAQPIVFGFYLVGVAKALERDCERLMEGYGRINASPLGAGALAGTGFKIDRAKAAELLGFEGVVENALDAVASRDYALELLSDLAQATITVSRLAQDLYVWASYEGAQVVLSDEVCHVSSIMPQKKNALTLEHCKAKAGHVIAAVGAAMGVMRGTPFSNVRDVNREAMYPLEEAVAQTTATLELMAVTIGTLQVNEGEMARRVRTNFSTVTELADKLVRSQKVSFRAAHQIVAIAVIDAMESHGTAEGMTAELLNGVSERVMGKALGIDDDFVQAALDPRTNVSSRQTTGSTNPTEVRRMIRGARERLRADQAWLASRIRLLEGADDKLRHSINALHN